MQKILTYVEEEGRKNRGKQESKKGGGKKERWKEGRIETKKRE